MVFTFENHFEFIRIFFASLIFYHEFEWQRSEVGKIQRWGPLSWIPLDYLRKIFFGVQVHDFHVQKPFSTCS